MIGGPAPDLLSRPFLPPPEGADCPPPQGASIGSRQRNPQPAKEGAVNCDRVGSGSTDRPGLSDGGRSESVRRPAIEVQA